MPNIAYMYMYKLYDHALKFEGLGSYRFCNNNKKLFIFPILVPVKLANENDFLELTTPILRNDFILKLISRKKFRFLLNNSSFGPM